MSGLCHSIVEYLILIGQLNSWVSPWGSINHLSSSSSSSSSITFQCVHYFSITWHLCLLKVLCIQYILNIYIYIYIYIIYWIIYPKRFISRTVGYPPAVSLMMLRLLWSDTSLLELLSATLFWLNRVLIESNGRHVWVPSPWIQTHENNETI